MWHLGLYTNAEDAAVVIDLAYWLLGRPVPNFPSTAYSMHPLVQEIGDVQKYVEGYTWKLCVCVLCWEMLFF